MKPLHIVVRTGDQHGPLQAAHDELSCLTRWPVQPDPAGLLALLENPGEPLLICIKESNDGLLHRLVERVVPGSKHPAETHPPLAEDVSVDRRVRVDLCYGIGLLLINGF